MRWRLRHPLAHLTGLAASAAVSLIVGAFVFDAAVPVLNIYSQTAEHLSVSSGGTLHFRFELIRYRRCPTTVYQWVLDGRSIQFPIAPFMVPARPLGGDTISLAVPVPKDAEPGAGRYQMAYTHVCRVLWWTSEHAVSRPYLRFTIAGD